MGNWRPRSLVECSTIFWRRKLLIFLFAGGMALATLTVAGEIPSTYQSQALFVISEQAARNSEALSARIAAAREEATSVLNLEPLIEQHHLRKADETMDGAVQRLRKAIKIETKLSDYYPPDFLSSFKEANETIQKQTERSQLAGVANRRTGEPTGRTRLPGAVTSPGRRD